MAFEQASDLPAQRAPVAGRSWMNAARVVAGATSLCACFAVALHVGQDARLAIAFIATGVVLFVTMLLGVAREASSRWLAFGALIGFRPGARRALLDMGTDLPVLHGNAGHHAVGLRILHLRRGARMEEWVQAEVDILADVHDPGLHARAAALGVEMRNGRLLVRVRPFEEDPVAAREFLSYVARVTELLERPA